MISKDIRLIFYLPNLSAYRDRAHLIGQIAGIIGKAVLVTSKLDIDPDEINLDSRLRVVELPKGRRFPGRTLFAASRVVGDLLREYNFNIVHDTFGHLLPLFLCKYRFPDFIFITSLYNLAEWDFRKFIWPRYGMKSFKYRDLRLLMMRLPIQREICSLADYIVVQAPELIDRLVKYIPISSSKVVWLPNNITECSINQDSSPAFMNKEQKIRLLFVGGFSVGKGADLLLDLLDRARVKKISLEATAVGGFAAIDEHYLQKRIQYLNLNGNLTIHERLHRDALNEFYDHSDWLFHVSAVDGSPRVVLEALVRGVPVIGSYHPGIKVVDPHEEFILFAEPWNPDTLLDELLALQQDPHSYQARAECGQVYVKKYFSSETVSERYVELYRRLLQKRSYVRI